MHERMAALRTKRRQSLSTDDLLTTAKETEELQKQSEQIKQQTKQMQQALNQIKSLTEAVLSLDA